jgi:hypothetical protein
MEQTRRRDRETWVAAEPSPGPWITADDFDYVEGTYADGYGPESDRTVTHTRKVLFVRPDYWIVVDVLSPSDEASHRYEAPFHLDVEEATVDPGTRAVVGVADDVQLAIVPLSTEGLDVAVVSGQTEPVVQGWLPTGRHNQLRPIPTPIFSREAPGTVTMAYALIPGAAGEALPKAEALDTPDGALAVALTWPDGTVHHFVHNPDGLEVALGSAQATAQVALCVVLPDGTTDRLFQYDG